MLVVVVKDGGNDRSARRSDKTFNKASRWVFASGDRTRRRTRWMRPAQARDGAEEAPSAIQGSTKNADQSINAGVSTSRSALTKRHTATRSGDSCGSERPGTYSRESRRLQRFGEIETQKPNEAEHRARSHPYSGRQRERTRAGWRREREQPEQPSSEANDFHVQRAERENGTGKQQTTPAREAHVEQRAEENTWVSTWTANSSSKTRDRV